MLGAIRGAALGLGLGGVALLSPLSPVEAQVTYQTGEPPPGALPPIDDRAPPAASPAAPATDRPVVTAPVPPADVGARPAVVAPAPIDAGKPDVNDPVKQTGEVVKNLAKGDVKALREGPLLIHGNYCGIGNRPGKEPTDVLDEACMHHDACTTEGKLPSCACDNRLQAAALRIARDPATPPKIQALAATMAASMAILICK